MKVPAKIEYAYKAIMELALRYDNDNPVQLNTISQSQGIPKKFLTQLLLLLKNANIVNSSRGVSGGYYLARRPAQISLADIFKAIDDTVIGSPKKARPGKSSDTDKLILGILSELSQDTARRLEEVTFDKLTSQVKHQALTYYI